VPICACLVALGLMMASRIDSLWMLYLSYGLVFAIGITGVGDLSHLPVISRWFIRKRGTAIGIAMAGMGLMTPLGMMMVVPHHVVYLVGQGFDKLTAAFAFGSLGAFSFTGRVVFGALSDRIGRVPTICLTYSLSIIGTLLLMALHDPTQTVLLWCYIVIYGLGFGARGPVTSSLVIDLFHGKQYGAILGFLEIGSGFGGTIGPWFSGFLFDRTGSYALSFSLSMAVLMLATVCAWLAGRWGRAQTSKYR